MIISIYLAKLLSIHLFDWLSLQLFCLITSDLTWPDLTWLGLAWPDLTWPNLIWYHLTLPHDFIWPEMTSPHVTSPRLTPQNSLPWLSHLTLQPYPLTPDLNWKCPIDTDSIYLAKIPCSFPLLLHIINQAPSQVPADMLCMLTWMSGNDWLWSFSSWLAVVNNTLDCYWFVVAIC